MGPSYGALEHSVKGEAPIADKPPSAMSLAEGDRLEPAVEALLRTESWRAPAPAPPVPFALPLAVSRSGAVLTRWLRVAVWQGYADGQGGDEKAGAGSSARTYHARCASCLPARRGTHPQPSTATLHRRPAPSPSTAALHRRPQHSAFALPSAVPPAPLVLADPLEVALHGAQTLSQT